MKTRGTRGGIVLTLDEGDSAQSIRKVVNESGDVFRGQVFLEPAARLPWSVVMAASQAIAEAGGQLVEIRPPGAPPREKGGTVIVARTVRSGGRVDSKGSVVVIGDVNAGAEIVAEDDIIVLGTLRGLAHAGARGNERAFIWAQAILAPQLRISGALAQAGSGVKGWSGPEIALLENDHIVLKPYNR